MVLLVKVWRSPHQNALSVFGAFAVPLVVAAAGAARFFWNRRKTASFQEPLQTEEALKHFAQLLAIAVKSQWTRAANERGLLAPAPIPVIWRKPSIALT